MPGSITMGQYLPACSLVHRMDPRAKIVVLALVGPATLMANSQTSILLVSAWLVLCLALSGIKPVIYWRSLKVIWILLGIAFLLQILFTPSTAILVLGSIKISHQGLISGGMLFWRLSVLLLITAILTFTTTPLQLTRAMEWILSPLHKVRFPVRELAMTVNMALRFVPTLFDEARLLILAQRARGADFTRGGVRERAWSLVPFLIPLLTNILRRADIQALALEVRCYRVGAVRSSMQILVFRLVDYLAMALGLVILLVVLGQRI